MSRSLLILLASALVFGGISCSAQDSGDVISSYRECVDAGNVILRSNPPQCVTRTGKRFVAGVVDKAKGAEKKKNCQNLCGDGACQVLVCQAIGCPCAESEESCPSDCEKQ
jgi:hypothetical protein